MRKFMLFAVAVSVISTVGCSGSDVGNEGAVASSGSASSSNAFSAPEKTVQVFLEAVRTGNADVATGSLTPLALAQIKKYKMDISPPASETSKFRVGDVDIFEQDKAFVDSVWTELDGDGKPFSESITWGLRLADGQWRISGMAADMGPDLPMEVVDFENPEQYAEVEDSAPAATQGGTTRQADQSTQDPFNETLSR